MWSSIGEMYPMHSAPAQAALGQVLVIEPQVSYKLEDYLSVQPPKGPYELSQDFYKRRLWIC